MVGEPYRRSIHIEASPEVVFEYWTNPNLLVRWMGHRAELDPRPGGAFVVHFGEERCMEGRYITLDPPHRLVLAWGRRGSRTLPESSTRLEVRFTPEDGGTRVDIVHWALPDVERRQHELGWHHYLARMQELARAPH